LRVILDGDGQNGNYSAFLTYKYLTRDRLPAIMGFSAFFLNFFFLEETYPPVILITKAAELRRRTKNWGIHAKQEEIEIDFRELITKNFSRPLRLLVTEPIVLLLSIYMAFIYGNHSFSLSLLLASFQICHFWAPKQVLSLSRRFGSLSLYENTY